MYWEIFNDEIKETFSNKLSEIDTIFIRTDFWRSTEIASIFL